ncbi:MAG: hypothetical protein FWF50_00760 [Defluviitaleaceae bacterium]|nr:hypothetical protein [Defluviitaleaceae bacterium]
MKIKIDENTEVEDILNEIEKHLPAGFELATFKVFNEYTKKYDNVYFDLTDKGLKFNVKAIGTEPEEKEEYELAKNDLIKLRNDYDNGKISLTQYNELRRQLILTSGILAK